MHTGIRSKCFKCFRQHRVLSTATVTGTDKTNFKINNYNFYMYNLDASNRIKLNFCKQSHAGNGNITTEPVLIIHTYSVGHVLYISIIKQL